MRGTACSKTLCGTLLVLLMGVCGLKAVGQCSAEAQPELELTRLYEQHAWDQVAEKASRLSHRSGDANFAYGMALAHLQRWTEARSALRAGRGACPHQKRFPIELAGVAFEQKHYAEAASWIEKALRLDPRDEYANDFAGTVFLLMGNLDAALKYWNRIHKPQIASLLLDPQLKVERLLLGRAFVFSPHAEMKREDLKASEARLNAMGIFPTYSIKLDARQDGSFDADFHAIERDGFGNTRLQGLISVFSGLPYETVYPSYFNLGRSATNFDSLLRWDAQKRRVWLSLSGPLRYLPQWRWQATADGRDENWAIRKSFAGAAPILASFKVKKVSGGATVTSIRSGRFQWTSGAEISHRNYEQVAGSAALTSTMTASGFALKHLASENFEVIDVPEHRFIVNTGASSEFARLWSSPAELFDKVQGRAIVRWLPQAGGNKYEFTQRLRGGGIAGTAPIDEFWLIGVERDTDLWLRGHIGTRGGRKGSSPIADRYFLANSDFYRSVWGNGLINIKAGPLLDIARVSASTTDLSPRQWLVDSGVEVKLSVLGTSVILTYGRNLRAGHNAFYGTVAPE